MSCGSLRPIAQPGQNAGYNASGTDYDADLPPVYVRMHIGHIGTSTPQTTTSTRGMPSAMSVPTTDPSTTTNSTTTTRGSSTFGVTRPKPQPWYLRTKKPWDCQLTRSCRGHGGIALNAPYWMPWSGQETPTDILRNQSFLDHGNFLPPTANSQLPMNQAALPNGPNISSSPPGGFASYLPYAPILPVTVLGAYLYRRFNQPAPAPVTPPQTWV
jgi:hypothetical protein